MWRQALRQIRRVRCEPFPGPAIHAADSVTQRSPATGSVSKLHREAAQHRLCLHVAAGPCDFREQDLGDREVLHESHDVSEAFMERKYVRVGWLVEAAVHSVE